MTGSSNKLYFTRNAGRLPFFYLLFLRTFKTLRFTRCAQPVCAKESKTTHQLIDKKKSNKKCGARKNHKENTLSK